MDRKWDEQMIWNDFDVFFFVIVKLKESVAV